MMSELTKLFASYEVARGSKIKKQNYFSGRRKTSL